MSRIEQSDFFQSNRKTIRTKVRNGIFIFFMFNILLTGFFFVVLFIYNQWFELTILVFIFTGIIVLCLMLLLFVKILIPFLTKKGIDINFQNGIEELANLNALEQFTKNGNLHTQIQKTGKTEYLTSLERILNIRRRDVGMRIWFYYGMMGYGFIIMVCHALSPIFQLIPYQDYIFYGFVIGMALFGIWLLKESQRNSQILSTMELIDQFYPDDND